MILPTIDPQLVAQAMLHYGERGSIPARRWIHNLLLINRIEPAKNWYENRRLASNLIVPSGVVNEQIVG